MVYSKLLIQRYIFLPIFYHGDKIFTFLLPNLPFADDNSVFFTPNAIEKCWNEIWQLKKSLHRRR
jgi:hypothetical protein